MKVSVEDQSTVKKVLHIEIPQEEVVQELDSAYQQLKKTAKIKGFRPGKAPRSVLERLYRKEVHADVTSKLIQESVMGAIRDNKLNILGSPKIDPPELSTESSYTFDAEVEVHPEIGDIDYSGLELTKTKYVVSDDDIDTQLKMLRTNLAKRQKITEDRPVEFGDLVVIDYEGYHDGTPHPDTQKTENFITKVGEGQIVKDLDEGLKGMQVGEEKEIDVQFPEDYFSKSLAGHKLVFKVKLNEIREEILPEINDEFAKSVSDNFESLDALKAKIRENLESGYAKRTEQEINEQIFKQLLDRAFFEIPDVLVDAELDHILNDAEQKFAQSNRTLEELGLSREKLAIQYRPVAEKQVRRHMILSKLMDQEKLELTDEEVNQGFQEMADNYQQPVDFIKGYYQQNQEGLSFFKHTLLEKKTLDLIISTSNMKEIDAGQDNKASEDGSESDAQG